MISVILHFLSILLLLEVLCCLCRKVKLFYSKRYNRSFSNNKRKELLERVLQILKEFFLRQNVLADRTQFLDTAVLTSVLMPQKIFLLVSALLHPFWMCFFPCYKYTSSSTIHEAMREHFSAHEKKKRYIWSTTEYWDSR